MTQELPIIGWREWVALPELGADWIKAKVDTGARTSSLHAWDVEIVRRRGLSIVRFVIHPNQRDNRLEIAAEAPLLDQRWIKSSSGHRELRPVIKTEIRLLGESWPIELTLTSRDLMGFRMLLGRQAIRKRLLVDAGRSFAGGKKKVAKGTKAKRKRSAP